VAVVGLADAGTNAVSSAVESRLARRIRGLRSRLGLTREWSAAKVALILSIVSGVLPLAMRQLEELARLIDGSK
jgi:hypothetical protein